MIKISSGRGIWAACVLVLAAGLLATGCATPAIEFPTVAKVNGKAVSELELEEQLRSKIPKKFHGGVTPEVLASYRPAALDAAIERELLFQEAERMGLAPSKDDAQKELDLLVDQIGKDKFRGTLNVRGISEEQYFAMLRKQMAVDALLDQEIEQKAAVGEAEAREYYERNKESYMRPEAWRVSHILISVAPNASEEDRKMYFQRATEVQAMAAGGQDFGQLAWDYSDDPYKYKHGDLGLLHQGRLMPEIEDVIKRLKTGEISGVIETIYGYHIIKLTDRIAPTQLTYEDVGQKITAMLVDRHKTERKEALLRRITEKATIERY